jgi:glutamate---cysteine ligase / carboxylate-amine ligase
MTLPSWAEWTPSAPYTVGIEEEVMILDSADWSLAQVAETVLPRLSGELRAHVTSETHAAAIELATAPHATAAAATREAATLRTTFAEQLAASGLCAGSSGTHPFAVWTETRISSEDRYQVVYDTLRELARREPTFAVHVHIGVPDPERAITLMNRLRTHLPVLLAISANSPFWQGRDTGLASARTTIFEAFPRTGIPRAFTSYGHYVETIGQLLRSDAIPEPTFVWWDVRPQPRFGTVEVRVMDAQIRSVDTAALAALVQMIAHLELEEGYADQRLQDAVEVLDENRFLALRDGADAQLIDPVGLRQVPVKQLVRDLLDAGRGHAQELGCEPELEHLDRLVEATGAAQQRALLREHHLRGLVGALHERFGEPP